MVIEAIAAEVETFWLTDIVRDERPKVIDEIRHGLGLVSGTLFESCRACIATWRPRWQQTFPERARIGARRCCASAPGSAAIATAIRT